VRSIRIWVLAAALLAASTLHAQLVNDGATRVLSNVTNSFSGIVFVGTNGPFTLLVLSNNTLLTNSGTGIIGQNSAARSNEARLVSSSARWLMSGGLVIGNNAGFNRLAISNGARVTSLFGEMASTSVSASNNSAVVTGAGSVWSNANNLTLGSVAGGNRLEISDGGWVGNHDGNTFSAGNRIVVTGVNSVWSNRNDLMLGTVRGGNQLVVSNGGAVFSRVGSIGQSAGGSNNVALVTGAGSVWANSSDLHVGLADRGNQLVVSNGAAVTASNVFIGFNSSSTHNRVTVDGGTLRVTNAAGTGVLDIRRGTNVLNAGLVEVDELLATNAGVGRWVFNGGTLSVGRMTIATGGITIGNGVSPATLHLAGNGTHALATIPGVLANASLTGNGTITVGIQFVLGSTLSPGTGPGGIGRLASLGAAFFAGTALMEIGKSGAVLTNDQFQVANQLEFLGTVTVSHLGPDALAAGDRFQLFPAGSYAGAFTSITLPALAAGLRWKTNLLVDGSIEVESFAPNVTTLPATELTQTNATLNGMVNPKGSDTTAWFEWGFSTNYGNFTPPQDLGSGNSNTNFSEAIAGLIPGVSYHFRAAASNSFGVVFGLDRSFPTLAQRDYVKASNTGASDSFGSSIAMDGDTLVVGAAGEASNASGVNGNQNNNSLSGAGAAYVFVRSGDSWVQQAYLKASNPGFVDSFGSSVAISGDTIVIGAIFEDSNATGVNGDQSNNSGTNSGAAYVFVRSGTNWSQQAYLKASNTDVNDRFGGSVAISSDTIVVGALGEASNATGVNGNQNDNSAPTSGAAYVFVRNGTTWSQQAYLKSTNVFHNGAAAFGLPVAVSGDTAVLGLAGDNDTAENRGGAYVFVRNGTAWSFQTRLAASNADANDRFGDAVALSGDTIVVGATSEDGNATGVNGDGSNNAATGSGAAYVFVRSGTTWTQQAYLKASNTGTGDSFGESVAVSADTVVVGAPFEDSNATGVNGDGANNLSESSGAAYVYARNGTTWSFQAYLKASNTEVTSPPPGFVQDRFGSSVAVSGDFMIAGAPFEDSSAVGVNSGQNNNSADAAGAVYVFGPPLPPFPEIDVSQSNTNIPNGGGSQQYFAAVTNAQSLSFSIRNTGNDFLTGLGISIDGPDAAAFTVVVAPVAPLLPAGITGFIVRFAPTRPGTNTATLHIASNDADENPFDIQLSGVSLSFTEDRDGDGLNDASELLMAPLGFNFQVNQTSLVNTLFNHANGAGLFTETQLQALNVNSPLLAHDPLTGLFTLTIGVEQATLLTNFFPFPMTAPQTRINAEGRLEFQFSSPNGAAFFRLEAR
jgi:T5SS/PEP-CTERM-associated repeat protein